MPPVPVYALESMPLTGHASIFLAGPTPRRPKEGDDPIPSWRPEALEILRELGFDGHVFIPEPRSGEWHRQYTDQVLWEEKALHRADIILFWIPRDMNGMPALTTNDEWGYWKESGKVVLGCPEGAVHTSYQKHYAETFHIPFSSTLQETVLSAVLRLNQWGPQPRTDGELCVPLPIWRTSSFQGWYQNLQAAGNLLADARVLRTLYAGPKKEFLFAYILWADVYISAEDRHKTNEWVFARPDISTIVLHGPVDPANPLGTDIVLIREFRTPVNNPTGYVWEVPGGSSFKPGKNPLIVASEEVREETGVEIVAGRFRAVQSRQLVATLSAHRAPLFTAQISPEEVDAFRAQKNQAQGVEEDTERTFVEVVTLGEIMAQPHVDWSMLGMITSALLS